MIFAIIVNMLPCRSNDKGFEANKRCAKLDLFKVIKKHL